MTVSAGVPAEVAEAMRKTNEVFCSQVIGQQKFDLLDQVYTADARILPPGAEMTGGRERIKAFWKQAVDGLSIKSGTLETVDAEACGSQVVEVGKASLATANGQMVAAKYVVYWKQEDQLWKWAVDIWNFNQ
jgi:ketosteroid isomerase-like protein